MRENPDAKETEVAKQLTKKWNDLSSEERGYYRDQAMKQQEALTPRSQKRSLQNDDQENNRRKIVKYLTTEKHENTDKQTLIAKRTILPWNVTLQDVKHSFKNAYVFFIFVPLFLFCFLLYFGQFNYSFVCFFVF